MSAAADFLCGARLRRARLLAGGLHPQHTGPARSTLHARDCGGGRRQPHPRGAAALRFRRGCALCAHPEPGTQPGAQRGAVAGAWPLHPVCGCRRLSAPPSLCLLPPDAAGCPSGHRVLPPHPLLAAGSRPCFPASPPCFPAHRHGLYATAQPACVGLRLPLPQGHPRRLALPRPPAP